MTRAARVSPVAGQPGPPAGVRPAALVARRVDEHVRLGAAGQHQRRPRDDRRAGRGAGGFERERHAGQIQIGHRGGSHRLGVGGSSPSPPCYADGLGSETMDIGFGAPVSGAWATPRNLAEFARRAERLGYRSLWTFQRLLAPTRRRWRRCTGRCSTRWSRSATWPRRPRRSGSAWRWSTTRSRPRCCWPSRRRPLTCSPAAGSTSASGSAGCRRSSPGRARRWPGGARAPRSTSPRCGRCGRSTGGTRGRSSDPARAAGSAAGAAAGTAGPARRHVRAAMERAGRIGDGWVTASSADLSGIAESAKVVQKRPPGSRARAGPDRLPRGGAAGKPPISKRTGRGSCCRVVRADPGGRRLAGPLGVTEVFYDLNFDPRSATRR